MLPSVAGVSLDEGARSELGAAAAPPPTGPAPGAAPVASLHDVAARVAALDGGAMQARLGSTLVPVGTLRVGAPAHATAAAPGTGGATAMGASSVGAGQWSWWNDSTVTLGSGFSIANGGHLIVQRSTVLLNGTAFTIQQGGTLVLENATMRAVAGTAPDLYVPGTIDAWGTTFDHVGGYWPAERALVEESRFAGGENGPRIDSANGLVRRTLFYNYSGAALSLGPGAAARDDTFVNNNVGVDLVGEGASLRGSVVRFNVLGIAWSDGADADVTQNDIYDNYQDGLYGTAASGSLDAAGNWWDGAPNAEGDSYGGAGVSASSYESARVAAAADRTADAPFALHSLKDAGAWPLGSAPLDGPVLARSGTLTLASGVVDMNGYRLGSHNGASLVVTNGAEVRRALDVLSRGSDSFDGAVLRGPGNGIVAVANAPTLQNTRFVALGSAYQHVIRSAGDASLPITLQDNTFEDVDLAITVVQAQVTLRRNTIRDAGQGILTTLSQVTLDGNVLTRVDVGVTSALDAGLTMTSGAVYEAHIALLVAATPSPTLGSYEGRFNVVDVVDLGSSFALSASNVYDDGAWALFVEPVSTTDPVTGQPVTLSAQVTIDPTTFVDGGTRGNVVYAVPRATSPRAVTGAAPPPGARVVASGQSLTLSGGAPLEGPVFARNGSTLTLAGALEGARHTLGAAAGARVRAQNASVANASAFVLRASDAQLDGASFSNASVAGLALVQTSARVANATFRDAPLVLWDASSVVDRSLFVSSSTQRVGLLLQNDSLPAASPRIERSWFEGTGWGVVGAGNPRATFVNASFATPRAIDDTAVALNGVSSGSARIDATASWRQSGATLRGPVDAPTRATSWRAAFDVASTRVTDLDNVTFTDASFDLDALTRSWNWSFGDGSFSTLRSPTHVFSRVGDVNVTLTTKDAANRTSNATRAFRVMAAPVARLAAPASLPTLTNATLDASASTDADGAIAAWRFTTSDGADSGWIASPSWSHAFARPGSFAASVRARDADGNVGLPANATIVATDRAPTLTLDVPAWGSLAAPTTMRAVASDPDGTVQSVAWDFGDGATATGNGTVTHQYASLGQRTVTVTATDDLGATTTRTATLTIVSNVPPTAAFDVRGPILEGATYAFTDRSSDADGNVTAWAWDFGDGSTSDARHPQHRFVDAGARTVRLTATDDLGLASSVERTLVVDDVLALDLTIEYEPYAEHATVHLFAHWLNGSAAPRSEWTLLVRWSPMGVLPPLTALSASGTTDEAGRATAELRSSAALPLPFLLPGRYSAFATARAPTSFGGDAEQASASAALDAGLT